MKTYNYPTVETIVNACTAAARQHYNDATLGAQSFADYYKGIGAQYGAIECLIKNLGGLFMFGADLTKDADNILEAAADMMEQAAELTRLAENDPTIEATDLDQDAINRLAKLVNNKSNHTEPQSTEESTNEPQSDEETTNEPQSDEDDRNAAREAFAAAAPAGTVYHLDTIEEAAEIIKTVGAAIRSAVGYGCVYSDSVIDANHLPEHFARTSGRVAIFYRACGTHWANDQESCKSIRESWGAAIVGRLTIEETPAGYKVTVKHANK